MSRRSAIDAMRKLQVRRCAKVAIFQKLNRRFRDYEFKRLLSESLSLPYSLSTCVHVPKGYPTVLRNCDHQL